MEKEWDRKTDRRKNYHMSVLPQCLVSFERIEGKLDNLIERADKINGRYDKHIETSVKHRELVIKHEEILNPQGGKPIRDTITELISNVKIIKWLFGGLNVAMILYIFFGKR